MDVELLIAYVHERRAIWQSRHKNHFNRGLINKYWQEIADCLQTTKDAAKSKWKNLKDQHRKELKKINENGGEMTLSKWPYNLLQFLNEELHKSQLSGSICSKIKENQKTDSENEDQNSTIEQDNSIETGVERDVGKGLATGLQTEESLKSTISQLSRKRKETIQDTVAKKMLILEKKKLELLVSQNKKPVDEDSEDYHFLMSLLPHMKALQPLQKLRVRNKVIEVLINETNHYSASASTSHSGIDTLKYDDDCN